MNGKRVGVSRKIAAVLAGGLVLGIGAATTMAAWTDSQYAKATFTAGVFKLESSADGSTWAKHTSNLPVKLSMGTAGMSPGVSGFGFLDVRTTSESDLAGTAALLPATVVNGSSDMVGALEFRAKALAGGVACNASALGAAPYTAVTGLPTGLGGQVLAAASGNVVRFCLEVRMKTWAPSSIQGESTNLTWAVQGTST